MKRFTLFFCVLCASMIVFGQVKVRNGSTLSITSDATDEASAYLYIKGISSGSNTKYGVYSRVDQHDGAPSYDCIGVYGRAYTQSTY
jgi:hypothetical protein